MNVALALFVVVGFAALLEYFDLPGRARAVGQRSRRSLSILRDDSMGDREKENALQQQSRQLFRLLGILVGGSALALGLPLAAVWLLERVGVGSFWGTLAVLERIDFLVGVTVAGGLGYLLVQRFYSSS
jgi:hypothetical protein